MQQFVFLQHTMYIEEIPICEWSHLIRGSRLQMQKLELQTKQKAPCERTTEEVSFEWLHRRLKS